MFNSEKMHRANEDVALATVHSFTKAADVVQYRVQRGRISWIEKDGGFYTLHEYFRAEHTHLRHKPTTLSKAAKEEEKGYYLHTK